MPQIKRDKKVKKTKSSTSKCHFTVVMGNNEHGLYVSSSPSSAARKAVSKLCATDKKRKVQFNIREITQGSKKKTYGPYVGEMKKLAKPIELKGRIIKYMVDVYLGKKVRNKMRGGENNTNFFYCNCDPEIINNIINRQYSREIYEEFKIESFDRVEYCSFGHVLITNRSKGKFLREDNKPEQITIYACSKDNTILCYAILRCNDNVIYNRTHIKKKLYQDKLLFLIPSKSGLTEIIIDSHLSQKLRYYEFKSFISSDGNLYRIIIKDVSTVYHNLYIFFSNLLTERRYNKHYFTPLIKYKPLPLSLHTSYNFMRNYPSISLN
jgi:hypothetical protein